MKFTQYAAAVAITIMAIACKKTPFNEPAASPAQKVSKSIQRSTLGYIQDFYGVNIPYVFIVKNPADKTSSVKLTLKWNAAGVASYTTQKIPLNTAAQNHRVFMPATEFNKELATLRSTHPEVKTVTLIYQNGSAGINAFINVNGVLYCWKCGASPALWNYESGWWYCLGAPGQPSPFTPTYVACGSFGVMDDVISFQTN